MLRRLYRFVRLVLSRVREWLGHIAESEQRAFAKWLDDNPEVECPTCDETGFHETGCPLGY